MKALNKNVVIKPLSLVSEANLTIPDSCQVRNRGTVISVGPDAPDKFMNMKVLFREGSANLVEEGEEKFFIISHELLLAEL